MKANKHVENEVVNNNNTTQEDTTPGGFHDTAYMTVLAHILIKDADSGKILLKQRG